MQKSSFKGYKLEFTTNAEKTLKKLDNQIAKQINKKLYDLISGSTNLDIKKLISNNNLYRLRSGDYRIIFKIENQTITILIVDIAHRKEAYRYY